ncbi:hypothetical protein, partial [Aeromonas caviae]|uniref:hypothetical protein n=1 Tax=Aeromonas caviae TaxID=648 RepID=UPI001FC7D22C
DARRQQGDGGGVFGDSQFTSTLSVNFHFPKIPRRTLFILTGSVANGVGGKGERDSQADEGKLPRRTESVAQ